MRGNALQGCRDEDWIGAKLATYVANLTLLILRVVQGVYRRIWSCDVSVPLVESAVIDSLSTFSRIVCLRHSDVPRLVKRYEGRSQKKVERLCGATSRGSDAYECAS